MSAAGRRGERRRRVRRPTGVIAAIAIGLGLLGGAAGAALGGIGALTTEVGHHLVQERNHDWRGGPWSHRTEGRDDTPGPASFWHPPREV